MGSHTTKVFWQFKYLVFIYVIVKQFLFQNKDASCNQTKPYNTECNILYQPEDNHIFLDHYVLKI